MWYKTFRLFLDYCLALLLIESQLLSNAACQKSSGYTLNTSSPVRVQRGLCVYVPCSFTVPSDIQLSRRTTGMWIRIYNGNHYLSASKSNLEQYTNRRFFFTGNVTNGDCSYYIEEPLPRDKATYYFSYEDGPIKHSYLQFRPYVDVTELTDKPTISSSKLVNGEEVTLTCTSPGRCRNIKPRISWHGEITAIRQTIYNITYEDGSQTFHSNITFTARKSRISSLLFCRVTFNNDLFTVEKQALNVEYSPSINITIEGVDTNDSSTVIVKDGDSVILKCTVDSNPNALITWSKEGTVVQQTVSEQTVIVKLPNIVLSDAGRFKCSAKNEHGVTFRTVDVIHHGMKPEFSTLVVAAIWGVTLLVLIMLIAALLIMCSRKKSHQNINKNLKDMSKNEPEGIYCYPEFTIRDIKTPEETLQKSFAGDDPVYMDPDCVSYASIEFSKLKPKKVFLEDMETDYSDVKKSQYN